MKLTELSHLHFKEIIYFWEAFFDVFGYIKKTKFGILEKIEILALVDFEV